MVEQKTKGFEPVHSAHAIDQVAMAVNFDRDLTDEALRAAREVIGKPEELPGRTELRGLSFQIGPTPTASRSVIAGYGFTKVLPDGFLESELHIQRSAVTFRTLFYTRWANIWGQAKRYFDAVLPVYLQSGSRLSQVSLNYVDKFISPALVEECRPGDILKRDSPFLCSNIFGSNDLWHCHSGRFERRDNRTKRLVTVNVDFISETVREQDRRAVSIASVIADLFNQATYEPLDLDPKDAARTIDACFQGLHAADKEVLRSIITDEMSRRIALGP